MVSSQIRTSGAHARRSCRVVAAAFLTAVTLPCSAPLIANTTSTWTGLLSANWSNAGNWSPATAFPNSATIDVVINAPVVGTSAPVLDTGASIGNLSLTAANSTLSFNAGNTLSVNAGFIVNAGTLTIAGNGTFGTAALFLAQNTTLAGAGTILLTDSSFSRIFGSTLTNANSTISGSGSIASLVTNQGTLRTTGGSLTLQADVTNANGSLAATSNGTLQINGNVTSGNLSVASGGQVVGSGTFTGVTLTATSAWSVVAGTNTPFLSGTFTNHGNLTLLGNGTFGSATLSLPSAGTLTLNGGGIINLTDSSFSRISSGNLTNVDNTVQGAGSIQANITNQSAIVAQSGSLTLNGQVDNTAGSISVADNGTLLVNGSITGGNLTASATSQLTGSGNLTNVTLTAPSNWTLLAGTQSPTLTGTLTNHGTITLLGNGTFGSATLTLPTTGNVTLAGGGTILLTDSTFSRIAAGNLINVDNTITGAGFISANLTNHGLLTASGGTLTLNGAFDNANGTVNIAANGTLSLNQTFTGGAINVAAGGQIAGTGNFANTTIGGTLAVTGGQFTNVTLAAAASLTIPSGQPQILGTFTNHGLVTILGNGTFGAASLAPDACGTTTLAGGGTVQLTDPTFSRISIGTLVNVDNTIQGAGMIVATVTNQGLISAQGGAITLDGTVDNTAGHVAAAANGTLVISNALTGGTLSTVATGQVTGSGTLTNVTLDVASTWNVAAGAPTPSLTGTFTNHGNITLLGNATFGAATLSLANSPVTLNGGGTVTLTTTSYSAISNGTLTNVDNTLQGAGIVSATLTNQATLHASGGTLTFNAPVTGTGHATVDANASIAATDFTQASLVNNGSFAMTGNGTLGSVSGTGTLSLNGSHLALSPSSPTLTQSNLSTSGANALDITNNKLIIEPTAVNKPATLAALQTSVHTGSLTSSTLAANFGIAVVDNAVLLTPFTHFGGLSVDLNSILIAPELLGDANIDGHVDLNDLNAVLNHLGSTTPAWTSGNFDGAATIDLNDLNAVLNHLGVSFPGNATDLAATSLFPALTPEPASLALLLPAILLLRRRRA